MNLLEERWRRWRADVSRSEEARQRVFKDLQAEERHAVRDYLSQITTIHLESDLIKINYK